MSYRTFYRHKYTTVEFRRDTLGLTITGAAKNVSSYIRVVS